MVTEFATDNPALLYEVHINTMPLLVLAAIGIACYYIWKAYKSSKTE